MQGQKEVAPSGAGVFVRLYWLVLGNAVLMFLLVFLFDKRPRFPSLLDAAYLVTVASLLIARFIDIRFLNGETGEGDAATMAHWRRYAMLTCLVTIGAWSLERLIIHFLK